MNSKMSKNIFKYIFILLLALSSHAYGQDYDKDYYFVYITHDQTSSGNLLRFLEQDYELAVDEDMECNFVFYLANGNNPILIEVNPEQPNKEEFDKMLELIGRNERLECFVDEDMDRLMEYFAEHDFVDPDGIIKYESVSWRLYITPQFWNIESEFISDLFWTFDCPTLYQNNFPSFTFEIYLNKSTATLKYDKLKPFGISNMGNINNMVDISDYELR